MSYTTYDGLFNDVLTAYKGAGTSVDCSVGSDNYIRATGLATALWGLYQRITWTVKQLSPQTADDDQVIQDGADLGLSMSGTETVADLLTAILAKLRNPPAGGNTSDYVSWSNGFTYNNKTCYNCACYPAGYGAGTVVVVVGTIDGSTSDNSDVLTALESYLLEKGPVRPAEAYALEPAVASIAVSITMTGGDATKAQSLIQQWMGSLAVGQSVYPEAFLAFCYQAGAVSVVVNSPVSAVIPSKYGIVEASSITVTAA